MAQMAAIALAGDNLGDDVYESRHQAEGERVGDLACEPANVQPIVPPISRSRIPAEALHLRRRKTCEEVLEALNVKIGTENLGHEAHHALQQDGDASPMKVPRRVGRVRRLLLVSFGANLS